MKVGQAVPPAIRAKLGLFASERHKIRLIANRRNGGQAGIFFETPKSEAFRVSVAVGMIFGIYPAVKASRINPIDALRYE